MKNNGIVVTIVVMFLPLLAAFAQEESTGADADKAAMEQRFEAFKANGPEFSLTVLPVVMLENSAAYEPAKGIALLFERVGVKDIRIHDKSVVPAPGEALAQMEMKFRDHILANPIDTDYAWFLKIVGTPQTGGEEFYGILLNRNGETVWKSHIVKTSGKPRTVLGCCYVSVARLCDDAGLGDPEKGSKYEGEWDAYFKLPKEERLKLKKGTRNQ